MHQKLVPEPVLVLVNNPKQPLHAINFFENKLTLLFFQANPFNGQNYHKDKGSETSDQLPFRLLNKFRKVYLLVMYCLTKFDDAI